MAQNIGVTTEVFNELTTFQKRIVQKNSDRDMVYIHSRGNPITHAQTLGWRNYRTIRIKDGSKGYILIKK